MTQRRLLTLVSVILLAAALAADEPRARSLALSSLESDCIIVTKWFGLVPRLPEGAMLKCGATEFLLLTPSNLLGHVVIKSPDAALEFVRLFTTPDSYRFFELDGMVELFPGEITADSTFNVVDTKVFAKRLTPASARRINSQPATFEIKRTVVLLDQKIYKITELVTEQGLYTVTERKKIDNAQRVGVLHFGDL